MNRKAQIAAAIVIVAVTAVFGFGQDRYSDSPDPPVSQLRTAPYVAVATLDVDKVFKKSQKLNAAMAPIRVKPEAFDAHLDKKKQNLSFPVINRKEALSAEAKVYFDTYQRMNEIVTRICKARSIGLVIRATVDPIDGADRQSILQGVNRPVVYSNVPDLTDEVIAELDRYDDGMKAQSAADVDGPWIDMSGPETGLALRYKKLWTTPIVELSNAMLATFLRQRIALRLVIPAAQKRLDSGFVDGTELYDEELAESLHKAITTK